VIRRSSLAAVGAASGIGVALATAALGAPAAARKESFELSSELEARVTAHQDLVNNAARSVDDFCKLTADTVQILDPVVRELARFGGSEHQSLPFEAVERAYTRTQWLVPGLSLKATAEVTQTGIDYRWLGKQAPAEARPLLHAMDAFETGPEGIPSWTTRSKDESACDAPERARGALTALVKAWGAAPACLRAALRERLDQQLDDMATASCFCAAREPALAAVRKDVDLLKKLKDTRGPELARRWLEGAAAPDARFGCGPEGHPKRS
jgi:hypothetical protein